MENSNTIAHSSLEEGYDFFIVDKWGVKLHFKISSFIIPPWLLSEAIEVVKYSPLIGQVLAISK